MEEIKQLQLFSFIAYLLILLLITYHNIKQNHIDNNLANNQRLIVEYILNEK